MDYKNCWICNQVFYELHNDACASCIEDEMEIGEEEFRQEIKNLNSLIENGS